MLALPHICPFLWPQCIAALQIKAGSCELFIASPANPDDGWITTFHAFVCNMQCCSWGISLVHYLLILFFHPILLTPAIFIPMLCSFTCNLFSSLNFRFVSCLIQETKPYSKILSLAYSALTPDLLTLKSLIHIPWAWQGWAGSSSMIKCL